MSDTNREEFSRWFATSKYTQVILPTEHHKQTAFDGWQARGELEAKKLEAYDARYQARVRELEEALRNVANRNHIDVSTCEPYKSVLSTTPDTALQRKVLEARIDEAIYNCTTKEYGSRIVDLRAQLASLNRNETLGE